MKTPLTLLLVFGLASCAPPKAIIVAEVPVEAVEKPKAKAVAGTPEPRIPTASNDGLRLPEDMLALPDDAQLRSSPGPDGGGGDTTVITRPPKE